MEDINTDVPVILLGGQRNTLAIARNLGRRGVNVLVSGRRTCWGLYSKFCSVRDVIPQDTAPQDHWHELLISNPDPRYAGAVVFALNDDALLFLIAHHDELRSRYILDDFQPDMYEALLDKARTLELAKSAGVGTPKHWPIQSEADLDEVVKAVRFPGNRETASHSSIRPSIWSQTLHRRQ